MAYNYSERKNATRQPIVERRQKNDWVVRIISVFSIVGWVASATMLVFLDWAKPEKSNLITRYLRVFVPSSTWNSSLLRIALGIQVVVLVVCVVGFILNMRRHRRKSDRYNRSLIILGIISLTIIGLFLVNFSTLLF
jgi:hypothetical protein